MTFSHRLDCGFLSSGNRRVSVCFSLIFPGVRLSSDAQFSDFLDGLGPAQLVGRQTLATPPMGEIQRHPFSPIVATATRQAFAWRFGSRIESFSLSVAQVTSRSAWWRRKALWRWRSSEPVALWGNRVPRHCQVIKAAGNDPPISCRCRTMGRD